jgi:kexin
MPSEEDDNDHAFIPTITATAATASVTHDVATGAPGPIVTPSDHPDRPTKIQPTTSGDGTTPTESSPVTGTTQVAQESTTSPSSWISWLPTFGAPKSAQIWIYGALGLIVAFCAGLGVYLWLARRRRLRNNPRDDYEFELLNEEEAEGLNGGGEKGGAFGAAGKKGRKTRGGELYDAFAGGSDDEDELFADDDGEYRDRDRSRDAREEPQHVIGDDDDEDDEEEEEEEGGNNEKSRSRLLGGGGGR